MIVLVENVTNVVIDIVDSVQQVSNGTQVNKAGSVYIYASSIPLTTVEVETIPEGVVPQQYLYVDGAFALNPNYVAPEEPEQP